MEITVNTIADVLGVTDRRVREIIKELKIQPKWIGRSMVFNRAQVRRMAKRNTKPGPKKASRKNGY